MTRWTGLREAGLGLFLLGLLAACPEAGAAVEAPGAGIETLDARQGPPRPSCRRTCDGDGDGDVDLLDLDRILAPGDRAAAPGDPHDADADGWIDGADALRCLRACTLAGCSVPPERHRPVADAGPDQAVSLGGQVTLDGSASSDLHGHALRYHWRLAARPPGSQARLSDRWAVMPTFVADLEGEYVARLVVDDCRKRSLPDTVTLVTGPGNLPPVADAGADQTVPKATFVELDGSASSDPDGDPLSFAWSIVALPAGSAAALDDPGAVKPGFLADLPGDYELELVVDDGLAASPPDSVRISTVNSPPTADAGTDQTVIAADPVTLDGGGSSDADGDPLTFRWSLLSQPAGSAADLSDPASVTPTFVADLPGVYVAQLLVHDGFVDSDPDSVTITAREPVVVTVEATDPDAAEAGPDPGTFTVARTGDTTEALTVSFSLAGPARNGVDYEPIGATVSLPAGTASAEVTVTPIDDSEIEGSEGVALLLQAGPGYSVGVPGSATVRIADDDVPVVTVEATSPDAAEAGPTPGVFTLTRTGDPAAALPVTLARGGTADDGADYASLGGATFLATFPAGAASTTVIVAPLADNRLEGDETVVVTVQPGGDYTVGAMDTATVTIADDPPVVTVTASDPDASEAGPDPGTFTVVRSGGDLTGSFTVQLGLGGTAANSGDYLFVGGSLTFPAGAATVDLVIIPKADNTAEGPETVVLALEPSPSYLVGSPATATVTLADDPAVVTVVATDPDAAEAGLEPGELAFTRSGGDLASVLQVVVSRGGTATNGSDYASIGGSSFIVAFPAAESSATVTITPIDDAVVEGTETVVVTIQPRAAYLVGVPGAATVAIADDD